MVEQMTRADYNEETGVSVVTLNTPYGVFTEYAKVHEEDKDIANRWDGIFFAYQKCITDMYRSKARMYDNRRDGVLYAIDVLRQKNKDCPEYGITEDFLFHLQQVANTIDYDAIRCRQRADKREAEYREMAEGVLAKRRELRKWAEQRNEQEG